MQQIRTERFTTMLIRLKTYYGLKTISTTPRSQGKRINFSRRNRFSWKLEIKTNLFKPSRMRFPKASKHVICTMSCNSASLNGSFLPETFISLFPQTTGLLNSQRGQQTSNSLSKASHIKMSWCKWTSPTQLAVVIIPEFPQFSINIHRRRLDIANMVQVCPHNIWRHNAPTVTTVPGSPRE